MCSGDTGTGSFFKDSLPGLKIIRIVKEAIWYDDIYECSTDGNHSLFLEGPMRTQLNHRLLVGFNEWAHSILQNDGDYPGFPKKPTAFMLGRKIGYGIDMSQVGRGVQILEQEGLAKLWKWLPKVCVI